MAEESRASLLIISRIGSMSREKTHNERGREYFAVGPFQTVRSEIRTLALTPAMRFNDIPSGCSPFRSTTDPDVDAQLR